MIMGFDLGHSSDSIQSSKLLATCLIGGVVLGVSVLGFYLAFPPPRQLSWRRKKKPIRVYMDGCFDMMHYGHCNALRQARALGDQLVVGVVSDAEITANKGPPVTPLNERFFHYFMCYCSIISLLLKIANHKDGISTMGNGEEFRRLGGH
ncbi:Ethanolamine-phosphate cytidylyltransferase [Vitis vinifera]|uniref:ethanolamine-phosphate cytidylyltransferase n=1 Tax=Vitis vinifera TaxID=29760 RepID=A0A438D2W9_VITVI|nr:Ethanolamine-phosphate cytidylyltransferase [Vitis vinifera]